MYTRLIKFAPGQALGAILILSLSLIFSACGDVDQKSTEVSAPIRPSPTVTTAQTTAAAAPATTAAASGATTAAAGGGAAAGDTAKGLALFNSNTCGTCHLQGGKAKGIGPALINSPRDDAYIRTQLKNGKGQMPAYPNLTEDQQTDIIAYIRSIK